MAYHTRNHPKSCSKFEGKTNLLSRDYFPISFTIIFVFIEHFLLVILPTNDGNKISDKTRDLALDDGVVADDHVLFLRTRLVKLIRNYN